MSHARFMTRCADETSALACTLGECLRAGDIVCLIGDLGAGKTTFVQGLARGLGMPVDVPVRSPTFTLVSEHTSGRVPLFHFDVYRLDGSAALEDIAFSEYLDLPGVVAVEWADKVADALPSDRLDVRLALGPGPETRVIDLESHGARSRDLLRSLERHRQDVAPVTVCSP